jgi:hypothetical protein|tara:strand:+ start:329 stop:514 length:186 start_codon:yes stop_codon:yes gene_type:complete
MSEELINQVTEYVYNNYKYLKNKVLIIKEITSESGVNHFQISDNEDSSPLILGKNILKEFQ